MVNVCSLGEFNKSSAKVGRFLVKVSHGWTKSYEYEKKGTGQTVKAQKFECFLVGSNPSDYMVGFVKGSTKQVEEGKTKFKDTTVWMLSKTALDTYTKDAWISSPKPYRVNLATSTLEAVPNDDAKAKDMPLAPVPPRTVAETACISSTKSKDLLQETKDRRLNRNQVAICDAVLIDGSTTETSDLGTLFVTIWGGEKVDKVEANVGKPLAFFNLTVKLDNGDRIINAYDDALIRDAPDCEKTTKLRSDAGTLESSTTTQQLSTVGFSHKTRDVSGPQRLSCAAFLDFTAHEPTATMPSVVQMTWLMIEEPAPQDSIKEKQGSRLWFLPKTRDVSGSVPLGCPERVALELAQATDMGHFEHKHENDALGFPLFVNARISRTLKSSSDQTGGASQSAPEYVSHVLEAVQPVSWSKAEAPNASFETLLTVLNNLPQHDECVQFAFLKDLHPDPHYGFKIIYDGVPGPRAACAAVFVESVRQTSTAPCGDGFKVETQGVLDAAAICSSAANSGVSQPAVPAEGDPTATEPTYTVVGYCNINGVVKLDPPRGKKSRFAVLIVDRVDEKNGLTVQMQKAEYIESEDAQGAMDCFRRLRALSKKIAPRQNLKRGHAHSSDFGASFSAIKKCRTLQAVPTDASMDGSS